MMKCIVCNTSFEAKRKDNKYCSSSCKQKAFRESKAVSKPKEEAPKQVYKFSEYEYVSNYLFDGIDSEILPFVLFAFFRNKIADGVALEKLPAYIDALSGNKDFETMQRTNAYRSFEEQFMNSEDCILY